MYFPYENKKNVQNVWRISDSSRILTLRLRDSLEDRLRDGDEREVEQVVSEIHDNVFYGGMFCTDTVMCDEDINFVMNGKIYRAHLKKGGGTRREGIISEFIIIGPENRIYPLYYEFTYECSCNKGWRRIHGHNEYKSTTENFKEAILDAFGIRYSRKLIRED